jgi:hypothetical protein
VTEGDITHELVLEFSTKWKVAIRVPIRSLDSSVNLILIDTLCVWVDSTSNTRRNNYQVILLAVKGCRRVKLTMWEPRRLTTLWTSTAS